MIISTMAMIISKGKMVISKAPMIISETETIVLHSEMIITNILTLICGSEMIISDTRTAVSLTEMIISVMEKIISEAEMIISVTETALAVSEKTVGGAPAVVFHPQPKRNVKKSAEELPTLRVFTERRCESTGIQSEILQIPSISLFEKVDRYEALITSFVKAELEPLSNQLTLFDIKPDRSDDD